MELKKIQDVDLRGQRVLMRASFNVPFEDHKIKGDYKVKSVKKTLNYIIDSGGKVTLMSNLGRPSEYYNNNPSSNEWLSKFSFNNIVSEIAKTLDIKIKFVPSCDANVIKRYHNKFDNEYNVFLLENVKFYKGEMKNSKKFAINLAKNFDVFVNESFSDCHRNYASTVGVTEYLPSFAGWRLQEEVEVLDKVKKYPEHPAVAIIGGAKIATKLPLIEALQKEYDFVLVGGKIAVEAIDEGLQFANNVVVAEDFINKNKLDIGPKTIERFQEIIAGSATIIWNGPMGLFEKKPFDLGTRKILQAIISSGAYSVVGGGESVQAVRVNEAENKISFISTGGGAMLKYLSGAKMPGLEVLKK